jgi:hypothetical protein
VVNGLLVSQRSFLYVNIRSFQELGGGGGTFNKKLLIFQDNRFVVCLQIWYPTATLRSRDSSVGIALGYVLDDWGSRVQFPAGAGNFLFTTASRTALGPTQPLIQWVRGALSLGVKWPVCEADHSPPSNAEVKE